MNSCFKSKLNQGKLNISTKCLEICSLQKENHFAIKDRTKHHLKVNFLSANPLRENHFAISDFFATTDNHFAINDLKKSPPESELLFANPQKPTWQKMISFANYKTSFG